MKPESKGILSFERFQIPYRVYGEGKDMLCLNGAQQSMAMWFSFLSRFSNEYRIILFDFPHQGKAKINKGSFDVSLDEQVAIMHKLIQHLNINNAIISSASWGGVVALLFALRFPQYIKKLVLGSMGMRPNKRMQDTIIKGINTKSTDRVEMAAILIESFGDLLSARIKNQIIYQFKSMSDERLGAFCKHGMSVIFGDSLDNILPLNKVNKETVVLYGKNDKIIDYKDVKSMVSSMPNCTLRTIDGVGHFLHLEDEIVFDVYREVFSQE